jgi:hypothetical protein
MQPSFIDHLTKLEALILKDHKTNPTVIKLSPIKYLGRLIEKEIGQKKNLGVYPRRRTIDQNFQTKLKQNSDINVIISKLISKNYQ